jgi:hypothetical protein
MPINPALLVAGVRPPEADAPGTAYARLLQIQQGQTANQLQDEALTQARMQTQQGQQAMYDDSRMRDLYASAISPDGKVDHDKIYSGLASISPKHAEAYRAGQVKLQGDLATIQKTQLENQLKRAEQVSNTLASVVDDGTKTAAVQQLVSSGLMSPEEGQQYASIPFADPRLQATLAAAKAKGMAAKDQATIAIQQHEAQIKADAEARQKAESDAKRPGLVAESQAKQSAAAAQSAGAITDQPSYTAWYNAQPPQVQQFYGPEYSPAKVAAITRAGMTGAERTTSDLTKNRDERSAQHMTATENIARGQLGVSQSELGLSAQRLKLEQGKQQSAEKALSGEGAKTYSVAQTAVPELDQLRAAFDKDYSKTLRGILLGTDRNLIRLAESVADKIGRLRSGGAINKDEAARFMGQIASWGDYLGKKDDSKAAVLSALDRYKDEATSVAAKVAPAKPGATTANAATQQPVMSLADAKATAASSGKSVDQVIRDARAKGWKVQ